MLKYDSIAISAFDADGDDAPAGRRHDWGSRWGAIIYPVMGAPGLEDGMEAPQTKARGDVDVFYRCTQERTSLAHAFR